MKKTELNIKGIPAILWGDKTGRLFVAVHGDMSSKDDTVIAILAEEALTKGYQVLSFDLPEHGDRKGDDFLCNAWNCVSDLEKVTEYAAKNISENISLFACSMGAYFSLLAYGSRPLDQCLFLSPILDMTRLIENMMKWFGVSEERLRNENEVETPIGKTLSWEYYCYVKDRPVNIWNKKTAILYGSDDNLSEYDIVSGFVNKFGCSLSILEHGEHFFHTDEQLHFFRNWLKENIMTQNFSENE